MSFQQVWLPKIAVGVAAAVAIGGTIYYFMGTSPELRHKNPLRHKFDVSTDKLREVIKRMQLEMDEGLKRDGSSSLKMLPTYVGKPTGQEKGHFFALDLGGTNFRVIKLELKGNQEFGASDMRKFTISDAAMNGEASDLFDFIADCVNESLQQMGADRASTVKLGFTFSFPVNQTSVDSGTLIEWTKGFSTKGVVGKDVVGLLNESFQKKNIDVKVVALANDTVGTMIARCYQDTKCEVGVILGTGTNACYAERISNIKKFTAKTALSEMIINMEWGGFSGALPLTWIDDEVDKNSKNPGRYRFEKLISGMYLGEITRLVLLELCRKGYLFNGKTPDFLKTPDSFKTSNMAEIEADTSPSFKNLGDFLSKEMGVQSTYQDRLYIRDVCSMIIDRAARLSAAAIVAVVGKIGQLRNCTVAVDGTVFERYPRFKIKMHNTIKELEPQSNITLVLSQDGSGIGAACIAAAVSTV